MTTTTTDIADDFEQLPPEKLQAHCRRQLSAMLDGELPPDEAKFMLRRVGHDADLSGCWERWQLAGDVMRGHALVLPADFAQRVSMAISADGRASATVTTRRGHWLQRWGGSLALAASVAAVTFVVAREWPAVDGGVADPSPAMAVDAFAIDPATIASLAGASGDAPGAADPADAPAQAAVAAVALASTAQRRRAAEATRRQAAAVATPEAVAAAPVLVAMRDADAVDAAPPARPLADAGALFAPPADARGTSRPWPRAVLHGAAAGGPLAAGYGGLAAGGTQADAGLDADPFAPRDWPREAESPATAAAQPSP